MASTNANAGDPNNPYVQTANDNSDFLKQLAAALAAAGGGLAGRAIAGASGNPLTQAVPPQLSQLLDNAVARQGYQNPLFQATTKGTYDMLPTFAKEGTSLGGGSLPSVIPPSASASGSGGGPGLGTAAGVGGLGALAALLGKAGSGGGGSLDGIINAIKKLFQHQATVQGNKPGPGGIGPVTNPYAGFQGWANNPNDNGMNYDNWPGSAPPTPNVNTNEWLGQWPENSTPFAPFDPGALPGAGLGGPGDPEGWG